MENDITQHPVPNRSYTILQTMVYGQKIVIDLEKIILNFEREFDGF